METKLQTKVTSENQKEFYQTLYSASRTPIDLNTVSAEQYLLIDCVGAEYRKKYPNLTIVAVETMTTVKQFKLTSDQFDYLIDNRVYNQLTWPRISTSCCAVIFNHSPLFKYFTVPEIVTELEAVYKKYNPNIILFQSSLLFIDDNRIQDRLYNLINIQIKDYVVEKFYYDTVTTELSIKFKIKSLYDSTN